MEYDITAGEHEQLIRVFDEEITRTTWALDEIEDQASRIEDEDRSDLGDDYDRKYEHREDLRELRNLIAGSQAGSGAVNVDEWQRSAIDQAREIIRDEAAAVDVEQPQPAEPVNGGPRQASFPAPPAAAHVRHADDRAQSGERDAGRLHYSPPSGLWAPGIGR